MTNEVIAQDISSKVIISGDLDGPPETTSSLIDAQPDSAEEDWEHIPALIPKPLKIQEQTSQDQGRHPPKQPINLADTTQGSEPASYPARNAFSKKDREITDNVTNEWDRMARDIQLPQAQRVAPLSAMQGAGHQNGSPITGIPCMTNTVPQIQMHDSILVQHQEQPRKYQAEMAHIAGSQLSEQLDRSMGSAKVDDPKHLSVTEDLDTTDSAENLSATLDSDQFDNPKIIADEDTPLEVLRDEEAIVAGLARLQIDTSGSEGTDMSIITMNEQSSNDLSNEHDETVQDDVKEYHRSPAGKIFSLESSDDGQEVDAGDSPPRESEHTEAISGATDDNKQYHQSITIESPPSEIMGHRMEVDAEESLLQHTPEDTKAIAVANDDSKQYYHSTTENPPLKTSNDEQDADTEVPCLQHHPEDSEAIAAAASDDREESHQSRTNEKPAPEDFGDGEKANHEESSRRSNTSGSEPTEVFATSDEINDIPITTADLTGTKEVANNITTTTETGDQDEIQNASHPSRASTSNPSPEEPTQESTPHPHETDHTATIATLQEIDLGTYNTLQAQEEKIASEEINQVESAYTPKTGMDLDRKEDVQEGEITGIEAKVKKVGWMESFRRFLFYSD